MQRQQIPWQSLTLVETYCYGKKILNQHGHNRRGGLDRLATFMRVMDCRIIPISINNVCCAGVAAESWCLMLDVDPVSPSRNPRRRMFNLLRRSSVLQTSVKRARMCDSPNCTRLQSAVQTCGQGVVVQFRRTSDRYPKPAGIRVRIPAGYAETFPHLTEFGASARHTP